MQIRLTVLGPRSGRAARACDVLITAPAGTTLGTVAGALASAAGFRPAGAAGSASAPGGALRGRERLAPDRACSACPRWSTAHVLSLHAPAEQHR